MSVSSFSFSTGGEIYAQITDNNSCFLLSLSFIQAKNYWFIDIFRGIIIMIRKIIPIYINQLTGATK